MDYRILTLESLHEFYRSNNQTCTFSAEQNHDAPIAVFINGEFDVEDHSNDGLCRVKLKVCHTNLNRNGSFISEDTMKKYMNSLKYRPVLGYIHKLEDGSYDFHAHDVEFVKNADGEKEISYLEHQIGCMTNDDPWLEYDEDNQKTYVMAYAMIPEMYTKAADIIRRKNGTKVSCEMLINKLSYDAKNDYLVIEDFYFGGVTCLGAQADGTQIEEGMKGARLDLADFVCKKPTFDFQTQLVETLNKLNQTLDAFTISQQNNLKEGGKSDMDKFETILQKYDMSIEDVTFDYSEMTEEEFEAQIAEMKCGADVEDEDDKEKETHADEEFENDDEDVKDKDESEDGESEEPESDDEANDESDDEKPAKYAVTYELSFGEIEYALFRALNVDIEGEGMYRFICDVFDDHLIYEECIGETRKFYSQKYFTNETAVSLDVSRVEVFRCFATQEELDAIQSMRQEFESLKQFKADYDKTLEDAEKNKVLDDAKFSKIADVDAFKELKANISNYSVAEISDKAKIIYAEFAMSHESDEVEHSESKKIPFNVFEQKEKSSPYAGLFD